MSKRTLYYQSVLCLIEQDANKSMTKRYNNLFFYLKIASLIPTSTHFKRVVGLSLSILPNLVQSNIDAMSRVLEE